MSDDPDLDQLRQQTDHGDRLDAEAGKTDRQPLRESIASYLAEVEEGERQKTVSVWDGDLAAFMAALEDHPDELETVVDELRNSLDVEAAGDADRSEVLRLALRVGLREAVPEYMEATRDAVQEHATRGL